MSSPETPTPVRPDIAPGIDEESLTRLVPPWKVILHNDDHNSMQHVVRALLASVPSLTAETAIEIMFTAHYHGEADVITCPKEHAEMYRDRLRSHNLTATIEPA